MGETQTHNTDGSKKPEIIVKNLSGQTVRLFPRDTKTSIKTGPVETHESRTALRVASEEKTIGLTPHGIPIVGRRAIDPTEELQMMLAICPELDNRSYIVILHPIAGRVMRSLLAKLTEPRDDITIVAPDLSRDYCVIDGAQPPTKVGTTRLVEIL